MVYEFNSSEEKEKYERILNDLLVTVKKVSGGLYKSQRTVIHQRASTFLAHRVVGFAVGMLHSVVKHAGGSRSAWELMQRRQCRLHTTHGHKDTKERKSDGLCTRSSQFSTLPSLTCSRNISALGLSYICL